MTTDTALPSPLVPAEVDLRTKASMEGCVRYVDGKPCVHAHLGERYTRNASCVTCERLRCKADKARIRALMEEGGR